MINNKLVLYCHRLEQAMLWEVCKTRRCRTTNCIFQKIVNHFGENLWAETPMRFSTIIHVKENLPLLTKPIPIRRTPVLNAPALTPPKFVLEEQKAAALEKKIRTPVLATATLPSLGDILRDAIKRHAII